MDDMVYNALRRKLAAAKAIGDFKRTDRLREMMGLSAEAPSEVPVVVSSEYPADIVEALDPPDVADPDVGPNVDIDE